MPFFSDECGFYYDTNVKNEICRIKKEKKNTTRPLP